ncbi:hypothetical protein L1887_18384 [Cichorium endivia]|nr:hypothetical protein L1887_18384 [Cichorium endivia]
MRELIEMKEEAGGRCRKKRARRWPMRRGFGKAVAKAERRQHVKNETTPLIPRLLPGLLFLSPLKEHNHLPKCLSDSEIEEALD